MNSNNTHIPVFLNECIDLLNIKADGIYIDCTFGRGGHSKEILKYLNDKGRLYAIDCDEQAINYAKLNINDKRFCIIKENFINLASILNQYNINKVDGFLFDLGISSPQLDDHLRGFNLHDDVKLDMRMDQSLEVSAYELINEADLETLLKIFYDYSDSKYAKQVATKIYHYKQLKPITTTFELIEVIKSALPKKELFNKKHPAKVFFQAIRIAVNNEFKAIEIGINCALEHLKVNGRIVVISFHSLENKIVKQVFKKQINNYQLTSYLPITNQPAFKIIKVPNLSLNELNANKRSHSAKLNVIERSND